MKTNPLTPLLLVKVRAMVYSNIGVSFHETVPFATFYMYCRFKKANVRRLADLLNLDHVNFRGRPLTPVQQVCIALNHYGGGLFTRTAALCCGVSVGTAWNVIDRVTRRIVALKDDIIKMTHHHEMVTTAQRMLDKYHLPGFAYAVDGTLVRFDGVPRMIPAGHTKQQYWCRKNWYGINVLVVGNETGKILYINADYQGSTHDARIWNRSRAKEALEAQDEFMMAGDSGFPISKHCITPYRVNEQQEDRTKRLFNQRHAGLRTEMTEDIFGQWKKRFPILNCLRSNYQKARRTIYVTAILHNLAKMWGDEPFEDDIIDVEDNGRELPLGPPPAEPALAQIRLDGQLRRDQLRRGMPPRLAGGR